MNAYNAIGLLSFEAEDGSVIDPTSEAWLGGKMMELKMPEFFEQIRCEINFQALEMTYNLPG